MATATREFQVMVKPIAAVCNLDCTYCYYLEKKDLYPDSQLFRMADDLLETYIVQHIAACPTELIYFSWHGGEPTALGIDYFRTIVELQRKHQPAGRSIRNGIQTNGTLVDEEWCRFLAAEGFTVGLSLDGPRELHDRYRMSKNGKATHRQVVQAYRLLRQHQVQCDLLCVVHNLNVRQPAAVYRFFKELDAEYLQFLPLIMRRKEGGVSAESVPAEAYGEFLCAIFKEWIRHDIGRIGIQNFDEAARPFLGMEHALCIHRETCGDVVVVEHNGDFYSCDHFVDREHRLGNIRETPLVELLESPAQREFGNKKRDALPAYCRQCEVLSQCNGGCPKDRFIRTPDGEEGLNYLCAGYKQFFNYSRPYLERMGALWRRNAPAEQLMAQLRQEESTAASPQSGRNDPCPCGSGKKYKKCCLAKLSA
jgi:uncharacterized protein